MAQRVVAVETPLSTKIVKYWLPVMLMLATLAAAGFVFALALWRTERGPGAHGLEKAKVRG